MQATPHKTMMTMMTMMTRTAAALPPAMMYVITWSDAAIIHTAALMSFSSKT